MKFKNAFLAACLLLLSTSSAFALDWPPTASSISGLFLLLVRSVGEVIALVFTSFLMVYGMIILLPNLPAIFSRVALRLGEASAAR